MYGELAEVSDESDMMATDSTSPTSKHALELSASGLTIWLSPTLLGSGVTMAAAANGPASLQ